MNALIYKGNRIAGVLGRHSVDILRVSLGLIFLGSASSSSSRGRARRRRW